LELFCPGIAGGFENFGVSDRRVCGIGRISAGGARVSFGCGDVMVGAMCEDCL
jgi:hypothetical protein